jgi:hypothetical protein
LDLSICQYSIDRETKNLGFALFSTTPEWGSVSSFFISPRLFLPIWLHTSFPQIPKQKSSVKEAQAQKERWEITPTAVPHPE